MMTQQKIIELLKTKDDGSLFHRESKDLEFKEQFNLAGLAEYFRDFAAFANNVGGYLVFGVSNSPRRLIGLTKGALEQFEKIDPEKISGYLLEIFMPSPQWEQQVFEVDKKKFGVFYIHPSSQKPVIAKKDEGKGQEIKNADIFFRYAGRTQRIQFSELSFIIEQRVKNTNDQWLSLMAKIAKAGPANAAVIDAEKGLIEKNKNQILVIDENLAKKLKFIKEGSFNEKGPDALRLIGDVRPMGAVEVTRTIQKRLIDQYPLSAKQLWTEVKKRLPTVKQSTVYQLIRENDLKNQSQYSAYNFRNKGHEEEYSKSGTVVLNTPSIYNQSAVDLIVKILKESSEN